MIGFYVKVDTEKLLEAIDRKMDEIVENIFNKSQEIIVEKKIIDEGTLLKSGNINKEFLSKAIIYSAPYADCVEFGRMPGSMPPSDPIKEWVRRKGIATKEPELSRVTWAILKHIERDGIQPRPFLSPAVELEKERLRLK
jgi:hypothetical protein